MEKRTQEVGGDQVTEDGSGGQRDASHRQRNAKDRQQGRQPHPSF